MCKSSNQHEGESAVDLIRDLASEGVKLNVTAILTPAAG